MLGEEDVELFQGLIDDAFDDFWRDHITIVVEGTICTNKLHKVGLHSIAIR